MVVTLFVCVQELGKEFLKTLKAIPYRSSSLSPFTVALALSVVRIHRFEEAVSLTPHTASRTLLPLLSDYMCRCLIV